MHFKKRRYSGICLSENTLQCVTINRRNTVLTEHMASQPMHFQQPAQLENTLTDYIKTHCQTHIIAISIPDHLITAETIALPKVLAKKHLEMFMQQKYHCAYDYHVQNEQYTVFQAPKPIINSCQMAAKLGNAKLNLIEPEQYALLRYLEKCIQPPDHKTRAVVFDHRLYVIEQKRIIFSHQFLNDEITREQTQTLIQINNLNSVTQYYSYPTRTSFKPIDLSALKKTNANFITALSLAMRARHA